jgi:hypothetical protein
MKFWFVFGPWLRNMNCLAGRNWSFIAVIVACSDIFAYAAVFRAPLSFVRRSWPHGDAVRSQCGLAGGAAALERGSRPGAIMLGRQVFVIR